MFDAEHGSFALHVGSDGSEQSWTSFDPHCVRHAEMVALFEPLCMQHTSAGAQSVLEAHASDAAPFGHVA